MAILLTSSLMTISQPFLLCKSSGAKMFPTAIVDFGAVIHRTSYDLLTTILCLSYVALRPPSNCLMTVFQLSYDHPMTILQLSCDVLTIRKDLFPE